MKTLGLLVFVVAMTALAVVADLMWFPRDLPNSLTMGGLAFVLVIVLGACGFFDKATDKETGVEKGGQGR